MKKRNKKREIAIAITIILALAILAFALFNLHLFLKLKPLKELGTIACANHTAGDVCEFTFKDGIVSGTCEPDRRDQLMCKPSQPFNPRNRP